MSQAGDVDLVGSHPEVPTEFITDSGSAVPIANQLEMLTSVVAASSTPFRSTGSGNTVTHSIQRTSAVAATDATAVGLAAFDSSAFSVDANGYVTFIGGGGSATSINVDANTAPGTDPVLPNGSNIITVTGGQVAAGTTANVIQTNSLAANTFTIEIQRASAQAATTIGANGVAHFKSTDFTVDANGFVSLVGGSLGTTSFAVQTGTSPVVPTGGGQVTVNGAVVAAGTNPIRTDGTGANTFAIEVQKSQAIAATDATKIGLSVFNSANFTVDADGFVSLLGGGQAIDSIGVDATSGGGTNPVLPTVAGLVTVNGAVVAAGTNPVRTVSTAANVYQVQLQTSQALAAADATKIGLSNFDSASFAVAATGFVTLNPSTVGKTITGDSGGALSPSSNNWNILGGPGVTTSGSGSTLTINSVVFTDQGSSTTIASDNGYFVTGAFAMTLPASPAQGEVCIIYADTTSTVTITANTGQVIRQSSNVTSTAGSITSGARGDSLTLRYRSTGAEWNAVASTGGWIF
jgi:hypothetical protein